MKSFKVNGKMFFGAFLLSVSVVSPVMAVSSGANDTIKELLFRQYPEFELQVQNYEGSAIVEYIDKLSESSDLTLLERALHSLKSYSDFKIEKAFERHQLTEKQKDELESFCTIHKKDPAKIRKIEKHFIQSNGSNKPEVVEQEETLLALKWAEIRLQSRIDELKL